MADKRQTRRALHWVERVKTWQLVVLLVLMMFIAATFLRLNNVGMVQRREAVFAADKSGLQEDMQQRLYDLQRYAASHMNADTGDIYLDKQYNRDVEKIVQDAQNNNLTHNDILKKADDACKPHFSGYTQGYVQCVANEQAKYPSGNELDDHVQFPNPALYKHSFASPRWSPDFAGYSVLLCGIMMLLIVLRLLFAALLRYMLHRHYRQA